MNVIQHDIKISEKSPVTLIPISDIHFGHASCDVKFLEKTIEAIKAPNTYTVFLGDMIDAIPTQDRRFENKSIAPDLLKCLDNLHHVQTSRLTRMFEPISDKILGILPGNHEISLKKSFSYDATAVMAESLNIPIITDPGFLVLKFNRTKTSSFRIKILCNHGISTARRKGGVVNALEDISRYIDADIYLTGHSHQRFSTSQDVVYLNNKNVLTTHKRMFGNTGSCMNNYVLNDDTDNWMSRKVFPTQCPGFLRFTFSIGYNEQSQKIDIVVQE